MTFVTMAQQLQVQQQQTKRERAAVPAAQLAVRRNRQHLQQLDGAVRLLMIVYSCLLQEVTTMVYRVLWSDANTIVSSKLEVTEVAPLQLSAWIDWGVCIVSC